MNHAISIGEPWMWAAFIAFVIVMLALDLFVFGGGKAHKVSVKEAALWSLVWFGLALLFNVGLWWHLTGTVGPEVADRKALEFFTGYLIEKSLSVDNVFVFLLIFSSFRVAAEYQRRVLIYGVLGAIVMRAVMILAGAWVVREFSWVLYLFGAFLVITGMRMLVMAEKTPDLEQNPVLKFARRHLRISEGDHGEQFSVMKDGVRWFTPLFLVLILIEVSDLVFAVDSIPAIFAITTDPFIVFTSNIFAIMGLRALYFLLADVADRFHLLKYGLAMVLTFIGAKMLIAPWYHMPVQASLAIVAVLIGASVIASLIATRKPSAEHLDISETNGFSFRARGQAIPGMRLALMAGASLALLAYAVSNGQLALADHGLLATFAALRGPILDGFFQAVTWLGSGYVLIPATILVVVLLAASRQWAAAWLMGVTYLGASMTTWGLKLAIGRERPALHPALEDILRMDWSFPSGHTTHAAAFALGLWLLMRESHPRWRALADFALLGLVLLVAASRLHLQVDWPSDVLAGLLVAAFWAGLAATLVAIRQGHRASNAKSTFLGTGESGYRPLRKLAVILAGLRYAVLHDFSVMYKVVLSVAMLGLALWLREWVDVALILLATGLLVAAELFNTAIEALCDFVETRQSEKIGIVKDIAAAAKGMVILAWWIVLVVEFVRVWPRLAEAWPG